MGWEMLPPEQPVWVSRCCPYECVKEREATVEAISKNRLETILLLHGCYLDACSEADSILSDLGKLEAECDRLTDRIKELEDALAEEITLSDSLEADIARLQAQNERFRNALKNIYDEMDYDNSNGGYAFDIAKQALEVDGGKV